MLDGHEGVGPVRRFEVSQGVFGDRQEAGDAGGGDPTRHVALQPGATKVSSIRGLAAQTSHSSR